MRCRLGAPELTSASTSNDSMSLLHSSSTDDDDDVLPEAREALLLQAKSRPHKGPAVALKFGTVVALRVATRSLIRRVRAGVKSRHVESDVTVVETSTASTLNSTGSSAHRSTLGAFDVLGTLRQSESSHGAEQVDHNCTIDDVGGEAHCDVVVDAVTVAPTLSTAPDADTGPAWLAELSRQPSSIRVKRAPSVSSSKGDISFRFSTRGLLVSGGE